MNKILFIITGILSYIFYDLHVPAIPKYTIIIYRYDKQVNKKNNK